MKFFGFVLAATVFEAVGDAIMRIALRTSIALPGRIGLFAFASSLPALYGLFLNLAPIEFAKITGFYIASLLVIFQLVNYLLFRQPPTLSVLIGGSFIVADAAIIYFWK
jgi:small multidrug resistance family-3 protein